MPGGPDDRYTVWLDHEPRDFKAAAAAGADLILSGPHPRRAGMACGRRGHGCQKQSATTAKRLLTTIAPPVSGGTGTWGYKFRTQGRTEIVCVEIKQV